MEKFDKNYIIGFVLLFLMYGTYMFFYEPVPAEAPKKEIAAAKPAPKALLADSVSNKADTINTKTIKVENKDITVTFNTLGAKIDKVVLNNYKTYSSYTKNSKNPMVLFDGSTSKIDLQLPTGTGVVSTGNLNFTTTATDKKGASVVVFEAKTPNGGTIQKSFEIKDKGFEITENIKIANQNLTNAPTLVWDNKLQVLENDIDENRKSAQINYLTKEEDFEDLGLNSLKDEEEKSKLPIKWFSFKQKYFTSGVVSTGSEFENASFSLKTPTDDLNIVKNGLITANIPASDFTANKAGLKYYFGPNELSELNPVTTDFQKNLYLGYDIVKPINRYVFVPLFKFVESFVSNYGLLIILVVLIIKLVLTPLIYKSYVSSAKMRILAPEVNAIKEKIGDDAMKVQQETMKLYQQVGVSPLSGCVPLLLQMPILMSVFFLFPNMIMFRQKSFLWSHDLSTYDAPLHWASNLPLIGNHISLFVVLMTLSSLAFTYYNNQITPDQPGPVDMKKISYIFPLVFFFVLNSFPAALSFYYLVSNLVTIAQQLIVRRFVDEDKIKDILEKNRKNYSTKPQKKSKFGDFLQKQLQASEEMKKQTEQLKNQKKNK